MGAEKSLETKAINTVLELMALAAKTAPKSFGMDCIETMVISEDEQAKIAEKISSIGKEKAARIDRPNKAKGVSLDWLSDSGAITKADGILAIGIRGRRTPGANCGGCGYAKCSQMLKAAQVENVDFPGPFCMYRIIDLGIAASSAVAVASVHHVDNRIFQKVGVAAQRLALLDNCLPILGIAVSATGKNIFFDRKDKAEAIALGTAE